jgi:hypothetical protein
MFAKSNWAVIGINPESLQKFKGGLDTLPLMLTHSQLAAAIVTNQLERDTFGINPFNNPRLDEEHEITSEDAYTLMGYATATVEERRDRVLPSSLEDHAAFAFGLDPFSLDNSITLFGFWFVTNTYKDVSHTATLKEQRAYSDFHRPVKFLAPTDKKVIDAETRPTTAAIRKQFPVLIDYREGRVYIESTSKSDIMLVQDFLTAIGAEFFGLAWKFETEGHWPSKTLTNLFSQTAYAADFAKRAEDASRFRSDEIEKLEDKEMQQIVSKYFSATDLGGDKWASLSAPAQITLHPTSGPIVVQSPTNATTLLGMTEDAGVYSASVTIQERVTITKKKSGEERSFRKDTITFDINDGLNLVDVGAALLRGFDLPTFKKDIQREIRQTKKVPSIAEFWRYWLIEMSNAARTIGSEIAEVLQIKDEMSGIQAMSFGEGSDAVIEKTEGEFHKVIKDMQARGITVTHTPGLGSEIGE